MEILVKKRTGVRNQLAKLHATVNKHPTTPLSAFEVQCILEKLSTLSTQLISNHDGIIEHCDTDVEIEQQVDIFEAVDAKIIESKVKLLQIQSTLSRQSGGSGSGSSSGSGNSHQKLVKLPTIDLPTFDGRYENWTSFHDLFMATIDTNTSLSGAQKLQYLKSSTKGEAAGIIKSIQITDQNYDEACKLLKERFNNEREITTALLKRLFSQAAITKESSSSLQKLLDTTNECIRALAVLHRPTTHWDDILVYVLVERMDPESRREWAMSLKGTGLPTFKELTVFMEQRVRGLLAGGESAVKAIQSSSKQTNFGSERRHASTHYSSTESKCGICGGNHLPYACQQLLKLSVSERTNLVRKKSLCFNCLKSKHRVIECTSSSKCKKCGKSHNTVLHFETPMPSSEQEIPHQVSTLSSLFTSSGHGDTDVLLSTVLAKVTTNDGREVIVRALLDNCSTATIISESCARSLGLRRRRTNVSITGISSSKAGVCREYVNCQLKSCVRECTIDIEALVMPKVTGTLPQFPCVVRDWAHLNGLELADPHYHQPGQIDILLGAEYTGAIMREGRRDGMKNSPLALNSIFGWVLSGRVQVGGLPIVRVHHVVYDTDSIVKRFWELEELPFKKYLTPEEQECENHFVETHMRDSTGRFVVQLPLKSTIADLGNSREIAVRRFQQVERRLAKQPQLRQQYIQFMREYQSLNHMEEISSAELQLTSSAVPSYYLPHHCVIKDDSSTTKCRVVFDGSAKTTSGISLNDCLMVGPTIQDDLFRLLLRFRSHLIGLKADIAKMYRQFKVGRDHSNYQRIVWRESPDKPIQDFRLTTVTYGTTCAPFLATRCLNQLAIDEKAKYPVASEVLLNDCYVDDLISGSSSISEASQLQQQLCQLVKSGGMELRKWSSSDASVLASIPVELRDCEDLLSFDPDNNIKALGVQWSPGSDSFSFAVAAGPTKGTTKRSTLSELAKVFDPLGFLSPVTIRAKIIMQELWKSPVGWDDQICGVIQQQWEDYYHEIPNLNEIRIPRCVVTPTTILQQLHGFCDASEKAYAAVIYLRNLQSDGSSVVRLITSKAKVAPIKKVSLPRLELCGAVLLTKLTKVVKRAMKFEYETFSWTDSTIVLQWLKAFPGR